MLGNSNEFKYDQLKGQKFFKERLIRLVVANKEMEGSIEQLEKQISKIIETNKTIVQEIEKRQEELQTLQEQQVEDKVEENQEEEQEMMQWIQGFQQHNGIPQASIDALLVLEYDPNNGDNQICLSCYSKFQPGILTKYLPCFHLFHTGCIDNHLKCNKTCPACQEEIIL